MSDKHPPLKWDRLNFELTQIIIRHWNFVETTVRRFGGNTNQAFISIEREAEEEVFHISIHNLLEGTRTLKLKGVELCEKLARLFAAHTFLKEGIKPEFLAQIEKGAEQVREIGFLMKNASVKKLVVETNENCSSIMNEDSPQNDSSSEQLEQDLAQMTPVEKIDKSADVRKVEGTKEVLKKVAEKLEKEVGSLEKEVTASEKLEKGKEQCGSTNLESYAKNGEVKKDEIKEEISKNGDVVGMKASVQKKTDNPTRRKREVDETRRNPSCRRYIPATRYSASGRPPMNGVERREISSESSTVEYMEGSESEDDDDNVTATSQNSKVTDRSRKRTAKNVPPKNDAEEMPIVKVEKDDPSTSPEYKVEIDQKPLRNFNKYVPAVNKASEIDLLDIIQKQGTPSQSNKKEVPITNQASRRVLSKATTKRVHLQPDEMVTSNIVLPIQLDSAKAVEEDKRVNREMVVKTNKGTEVNQSKGSIESLPQPQEDALLKNKEYPNESGKMKKSSVDREREKFQNSGSKLLVKNILATNQVTEIFSPKTSNELLPQPPKEVLPKKKDCPERYEIVPSQAYGNGEEKPAGLKFRFKKLSSTTPAAVSVPSEGSILPTPQPLVANLSKKKDCLKEVVKVSSSVVGKGEEEKTTSLKLLVKKVPSTSQTVVLAPSEDSIESIPQTIAEDSPKTKDCAKEVVKVSKSSVGKGEEQKTTDWKLPAKDVPSTSKAGEVARAESFNEPIPYAQEMLLEQEEMDEKNLPSTSEGKRSGLLEYRERLRDEYEKGVVALDKFLSKDNKIDPATGEPLFKDTVTPLMYNERDMRVFDAKYNAPKKKCNVLEVKYLYCETITVAQLLNGLTDLDLEMTEEGVKIGKLFEVNKHVMIEYLKSQKEFAWLKNFKVDPHSHYPESALYITSEMLTKPLKDIYGENYETFFDDIVSLEYFSKRMTYVLNRQRYNSVIRFPNGYFPKIRSSISVTDENDESKFILPGGAIIDIQTYSQDSQPSILEEQNWKRFRIGSFVWVRFKKDWWPAVIIGLDNNIGAAGQPIKREPKVGKVENTSDELLIQVRYLTGDRSFIRYEQVDYFDLSFVYRFDATKKDAKYLSAVVFNIRQLNRKGYFEEHITSMVATELKKEGWVFDYLPPFQDKRLFTPESVHHLPDPMVLLEYQDRLAKKAAKNQDRLAKEATENQDRPANEATENQDRLAKEATKNQDRPANEATENQDRLAKEATKNQDRPANEATENQDRLANEATENQDRLAKEATENQDRPANEATENQDRLAKEATENQDRLAEKATENQDRLAEKATENQERLIYKPFVLNEEFTKKMAFTKFESKRLTIASYNVDLNLFSKYLSKQKNGLKDAPIIYQPTGHIQTIFAKDDEEPSSKRMRYQ